jgi:winged helix DNA-binding protein
LTDPVAELTWPQVHAFRLERHHLNGRAPKKDLARVVGEIGGAQAQVMSAAELQIAVRVNCTVNDVRDALWEDRSLIKTWLMRGTLHLTRAQDLPVFTAAMGKHWISVRPSWLKFWNVTEPELWKIVDDIGDALDSTPKTREQVIAAVADGRPARIREALSSGWGGMLKPAARNGRLCFGPNRGQNVTFVDPREWIKGWREVDPETAIVEMARRYLSVYGPATRSDFARWWGAWPGVGNAAWDGLASDLVTVSVDGSRLDALAGDVTAMKRAKVIEPVQLLPLFDPYLMGYARRDHLVEPAYASRVSRTAGWISAVVLVDGVVAGTWTHVAANRTLRVSVEPFRRLSASVTAQARLRAADLARALGLDKTEVKFA